MITGTARNSQAGITVTVGPGGGLTGLTLAHQSMRLGRQGLAAAILDLVDRATAEATARARQEFGLADSQLDALGMGLDARLAEAVESTTPDTWRA